MQNLSSYFGKLFRTWIIYAGLLPWLYDFFNAYLPDWMQFKLSMWISAIFLSFMSLVAGYRVWREERIMVEKLELERKPKYEVSYREESLNTVSREDMDKAESQIHTLHSQIISNPNIANSYLRPVLERKIGEYQAFIKAANKHNQRVRTVSKVTFLIKNCSASYDEKISIAAKTKNPSTKIIKDYFSLENVPKLPSPHMMQVPGLPHQEIYMSPGAGSNEAYRDIIYEREDGFSVELAYLRAGEQEKIIECYIEKPANLSFEIISKNARESFFQELIVE